MEVDFDDVQFGRDLFAKIEGMAPADLIAQVKATAMLAQARIGQLQTVPEPPKAFDFTAEKNALLGFMQSLPAGHLSVFCQKLWNETEKKMQRIEQQTDLKPDAIAAQKQQALIVLGRQVGQAVLASGQLPDETTSALLGVSPVKGVQDAYAAAVNVIVNRVRSFGAYQTTAGIEDAGLSVSLRTAREIACALLTPQGQLNLAIVPDLRAAFLPKDRPLLDFEVLISNVLSRASLAWQPLLDAVVKPTSDASTAALTIRSDLNLSPTTPLQDLHAKQAVLAALLSHHNQGPVGDCFAVSVAIKLHDEFLTYVLQQYGQLMQFGSLEKIVNGKSDRFFFVDTCADDNLASQITVDPTGKLGNGTLLWNAPSFKFALQQMGITNPTGAAPAALQALGASSSAVQTTPQAVLQAFAAAAPGSSLAAGLYGFSTIDCRVLRAFETTLASMAEARSSDYVRSDFLQSVDKPLQYTYRTLVAKYQMGVVSQFRSALQETLNNRVRYVYNAAIQDVAPSSDGSSTAGGFELYDRNVTDLYQMGTRIATPQQFQQLVLDAVNQTAQGFGDPTMLSIAAAVAAAVQDSGFMKRVLIAYEPTNAQNPDPVANYQALPRTPMASQDGADSFDVAQIDTGLSFSPNVQTAHLTDASSLLDWVLGLVSWKESTQHYLESADPDALDPVESPQHAFNLAVGDAEMVDFLKSGQSAQAWTQARLYTPGAAVANWIVDSNTKNNFISAIVAQLNQKLSWAVPAFYKGVNALSNRSMTLAQFSSSVVHVLKSVLQGVDPNQLALVCDALLLQALPQEQLSALEQSAVRVALTNWNDSDKDIYFCTYFNPRTQALALGTIDEDFTALTPMDQSQWLHADWSADVANELGAVAQ